MKSIHRATIAYVRETNLLSDDLVASYVLAQQTQVTRDLAAVWQIDATCVFVPFGAGIPPDAWVVHLRDHSPTPGALGFHDDKGNPVAYVFVADDLHDGMNWTVTSSHETLEMLVDPTINLTRNRTLNGTTWEYAVEVCDASEDDQFGYWITGKDGRAHLMSSFVTPDWFDEKGKAPFAFPIRVPIVAPWQLLQGGYIGRKEIAPQSLDWTQQMAQQGPRANKKWFSRTKRRFAA
jgi:hypothetical protein